MQSFSFPITLWVLVQGYGEETIGYVTLGYPRRRCAETGKGIRNVGITTGTLRLGRPFVWFHNFTYMRGVTIGLGFPLRLLLLRFGGGGG